MTPFSNLGAVDADPLIAIMTAFCSDPSPGKVDLGVGAFRDDSGATPGFRGKYVRERRKRSK